jgi:hypothetical protein
LQKHVSLSCLHFSLVFSEGEVKSPYFLQVWWALKGCNIFGPIHKCDSGIIWARNLKLKYSFGQFFKVYNVVKKYIIYNSMEKKHKKY